MEAGRGACCPLKGRPRPRLAARRMQVLRSMLPAGRLVSPWMRCYQRAAAADDRQVWQEEGMSGSRGGAVARRKAPPLPLLPAARCPHRRSSAHGSR